MVKVPDNIFGRIRPQMAIFTTPNCEYNVVFPSMQKNGFRHEDHKFEWRRDEFRQWALDICQRYPNYRVAFMGIGVAPDNHPYCGPASQMAIFVTTTVYKKYMTQLKLLSDGMNGMQLLKNCFRYSDESGDGDDPNGGGSAFKRTRDDVLESLDNTEAESKRACLDDNELPSDPDYKVVLAVDYPIEVDARTREEKILCDITYYLNTKRDLRHYYNYERQVSVIPWLDILEKLAKYHVDKKELLDILMDNNYNVEGDFILLPEEEWDESQHDSFYPGSELIHPDDDANISDSDDVISIYSDLQIVDE